MTERRLEKRLELDASPEQVWDTIATGPGISAWFMPHVVEPRLGGTIEQDLGDGLKTSSQVTAWEPGKRFAYGSSDGPEHHPGFAYEFLVEARDGGGTVLRFVQSGFLDAPRWDNEGNLWNTDYDSLDTSWDLFFANLRRYLDHFAGLPARNVVSGTYTPGPAAEVWRVLHRALGLTGPPALGAAVVLAPDGPPPIDGVVDVATAQYLGVRSASGLHRIGAEGDWACGVSAHHYFYRDPVDVTALTAQWQGWLDGLFPAPES